MPTDGARPQRRFPWILAAAAAVSLGARMLGPSVQNRVSWVPLAEASALARQDRPILYNFTAEWCGPCKRLEREVFAAPFWASSLSRRYVPVQVVDREREDGHNPPEVEALQERFEVGAFPTLVVAGREATKSLHVFQIMAGQIQSNRKQVAIVAQDEAGADKARFVVTDAWHTKYDPSDLSGKGNEVFIELLELVNEGIERVQ